MTEPQASEAVEAVRERVVEERARKICDRFRLDPNEMLDPYGPVLRWHEPAYQISEAIAAVEATLRPAIEAEVVGWLRKEGGMYLAGSVNGGETETITGAALQVFADAIERGDHRTKGRDDG